MIRPISDYLAELDRLLPTTGAEKRRAVAEIRDYLLEAKAEEIEKGRASRQAEEIAIQRLGPVGDLATRLGGGISSPSRRARARPQGRGYGGWNRRYTPLLLLGLGVFLAATILPSALNLPLSNPSQTL